MTQAVSTNDETPTNGAARRNVGKPAVMGLGTPGTQAQTPTQQHGSRPVLMDLRMPFYPVARDWGDGQLLDPRLVRTDAYVAALSREALGAAADYADCAVRAVRLSGGVCSHLADAELGTLLREIRQAYDLGACEEVSLRVQPGMVSAATTDAIRIGHVGRLVVDFATSSVAEWRRLGRFLDPGTMEVTRTVLGPVPASGHGACLGGREVDLAFELLAGLPGQTARSGAASVEAALGYGATEVRLVGFELAPGSAMAHKRAKAGQAWCDRPENRIPAGEELTKVRTTMEERLAAAGLAEYLPGLWALPGHESAYERAASEGCETLGFGLGAVTRFDGMEAHNTQDVTTYLRFSDDPTRCVADVRPLAGRKGR